MLDTDTTDLKENLLLTVPKRRSCPMPWRSTRGSTVSGRRRREEGEAWPQPALWFVWEGRGKVGQAKERA